MSRMLNLADIRSSSDLPTDTMFADIFDGDILVAHVRWPSWSDREHRGQLHVTLYTLDRTVQAWSGWTRTPVTRIKANGRVLRTLAA